MSRPGTVDAVLLRVRIDEARDLAYDLLRDVGDRWQHTQRVARCAEDLSPSVAPADRIILVAADWLHDIGYNPQIATLGFHPVDGAAFLDWLGWPRRVGGLVAHHSGARHVAHARGLDHLLAAYPDERSAVSDALAYADQTTGTRGQPMRIGHRIAATLRRHGPDSVNAQVAPVRIPDLLASGRRVEARLISRPPPMMASDGPRITEVG